jgi:hypothetical protein
VPAEPIWASGEPALWGWQAAFACCDGEVEPRVGGTERRRLVRIYHSRGCFMRDAQGRRGPVAPRPDVTRIEVTATVEWRQQRTSRARQRAWERDRRRSEVAELAEQGLGGRRIARALGIPLRTICSDLSWLRAHGAAVPAPNRLGEPA